MGTNNSLTHRTKKERLKELISITGLSYLGFEVFIGYKSENKYIYSIMNGNKPISDLFQKRIEEYFNLKEGIFQDLENDLDEQKIKRAVSGFKVANSRNPKYFEKEDETVKVIKDLISRGFFSEKRSVKIILERCEELGHHYTSSFLTHKLINMVRRGLLVSEKQRQLLKDGTQGDKQINVYSEPNQF